MKIKRNGRLVNIPWPWVIRKRNQQQPMVFLAMNCVAFLLKVIIWNGLFSFAITHGKYISMSYWNLKWTTRVDLMHFRGLFVNELKLKRNEELRSKYASSCQNICGQNSSCLREYLANSTILSLSMESMASLVKALFIEFLSKAMNRHFCDRW